MPLASFKTALFSGGKNVNDQEKLEKAPVFVQPCHSSSGSDPPVACKELCTLGHRGHFFYAVPMEAFLEICN